MFLWLFAGLTNNISELAEDLGIHFDDKHDLFRKTILILYM